MKSLKLTARPEGLTLELEFPEELDLFVAIKAIKAVFPTSKIQALGGPVTIVRQVLGGGQKQENKPQKTKLL